MINPVKKPMFRAGLAFLAVVVVGGVFWLEWDARADGFAGYFDRRKAHASGILSGAEWRAMRVAGDSGGAAHGNDGCSSDACRNATAMLSGRWGGSAGCSAGNTYRFSDDAVEVGTLRDGQPVETVRRRYRIVTAPVVVRPVRDVQGRVPDRSITKLPGDIEVFTLGRSAYVRRIFRAVDADTIKLVLVEQRTGRHGPAEAVVIDGRATSGGAEIAYRRCPAV